MAAVHTQLIEPAMRSIGELWERNEITVAAEHLATAISHAVAARIFARAFHALPRSRERVMMAAVQGEHHVLGLRLAADVLEGAGYDVLYLGPDVPLPALLDACRAHQPDVLGLTASMWLGVPTLIREIHSVIGLEHPPRVMIGGRAATHAVKQGVRAAVVEHSDQVLAVTERLLAAAPARDLISPTLAARVPLEAPVGPIRNRGTRDDRRGVLEHLARRHRHRARQPPRDLLEQLAYRDPLTGLQNAVRSTTAYCARPNKAMRGAELLLIDIDKLKQIKRTPTATRPAIRPLISVSREILSASLPICELRAVAPGDVVRRVCSNMIRRRRKQVEYRIRTAVAKPLNTPPVTVSARSPRSHRTNDCPAQRADRGARPPKQLAGDIVKRLER